MLTIRPIAAALNPPEQVAAAVARAGERLQARGIGHRFVTGEGDAAAALLIVTGGSEHLALAAAARIEGPVFLLAHGGLNSLPAALETLARLRQRGRPGRIFPLEDDDPALARLARHLEVRRRLHGARLGRIGAPSAWLVASTPAPELVHAVWGPHLLDVPMDEVFAAMRDADPGEVERIRADALAGADAVAEPSAADLDAAARVSVALGEVVRRHRLDACAVRCFDLVTCAGTSGCLALSRLQDEGTVAACEGDVPAALTLLWLRLAGGGGPGFMANPQAIDTAAGTVWLAHCTVPRRMVTRYALRSHFESGQGVAIAGEIAQGPVTVARIGGADLRGLFAADGEVTASGAEEDRCRTQVQVRIDADLGELLSRPLGNHLVLAPGHLAGELAEYHELFVAG